ncbi:uncharacterized protein LOC127869390 [Dreissena polymorpha]|uniref:uncharacterized protein LOC127869390 n=1 Tax=Dreissena polymorpha TaxID=45954 RepID=UPI0022651C3C|nr:uncharacterized protein LOC127869390 [Dreissena polymorpha]
MPSSGLQIFNAVNRPPETPTCAKSRGITLAFLSTSGQPGDANIVVRVFTETQDSAYFTADAKRTVMWVVVGVVISLGVISAALLVMFVFCCCRKRPLKHVGQLHRDPFPIDAEHPMTDINAEEVFAEQIESRSQPEELPRDTTYEITNTEEELGAIGGESIEFETLSVNASQIVHTLDYENASFAIESET